MLLGGGGSGGGGNVVRIRSKPTYYKAHQEVGNILFCISDFKFTYFVLTHRFICGTQGICSLICK